MGSMAMPTQERSKPLHNFSLPYLKWGNQRVLRCVKIPPPPPPPPPHHHHHHRQQSSAVVVANGAIQSRPTIQNPVQQRPSSSNPDLANGDESSPPPSRPWNLRTRRAACKAPGVRGAEEKGVGVVVSNNNNHFNESGHKRGGGGAYWEIESSPAAKRQCLESPPPMMTMKERVNNRKLCVPLTRDEIEEDFMEIARMRPPRRPKKRPRIVQKYMDLMFPGLWLTEVTTDLYKVPEVPES